MAAVLFIPAAGASYKCVDEKGITRIGDTPPPECEHVPMYEMSATGSVRRKIDPTPTPDQLKTRLEEQEKAKEAEHAAAEQKRKDMALLASYSNETEFDVARDRNVEPIQGRLRNAQERLKEVEKRIKGMEDEMEFYKSGKAKSGKDERAAAGPRREPRPLANGEGVPGEIPRELPEADRGNEGEIRDGQEALDRAQDRHRRAPAREPEVASGAQACA